ncbi:type VI secretion system Vgr family protein [Frigidibacter sp. ROC022]|uniref:type VI secretion system Vgr family protein n=1 Tax=Frigidibacter sp. ROC022 TaxID=2971796 RepID=UPI00215AD027|nr:type VI secretion system tip protein TssI/VgrG [Frigidibacter sp. ROC022]MCR8723335.1 type VI secretion system tip protein VgrG [Frigidibacter sp. ROC022]
MAKSIAQLVHPLAKVVGDFSTQESFLISAQVTEELSTITRARIVFAVKDSKMGLDKLLGTKLHVELLTKDESPRKFLGTCIEAEYLGISQGYDMFAVETRAWLWFLTQSSDNRIFQDKSIPEIVEQVCKDLGFTDVELKLSATYSPRTYVVQYNETNFDFISRLMEEAGIYYFFDHSGGTEKLVLADGLGAHQPLPQTPELEFKPRVQKGKREMETVFEWSDRQKVVTGKVSLQALEFTTPNTNLGVTSINKKGKHSYNELEIYSMDGHYSKVADGENFAKVAVERHASEAERWTGAANARTMTPGATFKLKGHERLGKKNDFLLVKCTHYFQIEVQSEEDGGGELEQFVVNKGLNFPSKDDMYLVEFEVTEKSEQFRPKATTAWPKMSGVHRGVVSGPEGEEIYVDEYGRIKVFFYWDRQGKEDENSSCWVRVTQPFAGKGYGTMFIPRIGSEVLIAFERDDPDYPICIGQIYNNFEPVPYTLPDNMTQTGIKTESTKGGGGFHELVFEDKKDEEFIRLQSEKDWFEKIKNNAEITIGLEKMDPGDMSLTVYNSMTELLMEGDHTFTVDKGSQTIEIEKDHTATIRSGNHTTNVDGGNHTLTIASGDQTTNIDSGKMTVTAAKSIELVVGGSSIKIEPSKITMTSVQIDIKADAALTAEAGANATFKGGASGTFDGGGMATLKGGLVKIN